MKTPVVTLKVSPFELQAIDDALHLMLVASKAVAQSSLHGGGISTAVVDGDDIVSFVLDVVMRTAEGDPRRIPIRVSKLRESIGLV